MPVQPASKDGRPGYRWGEHGHVYTYRPGDERGRRRARALAARQGAAVQAADARPWKIDRPGAPSPRAYLQLVNRTMRRWRREIYRALGLDRTGDAEDPKPKTPQEEALESLRQQERARSLARRLQLISLVPPPPPEIEAVNRPAARTSMRTARRSVENAGIPRAEVAVRLGVDEPLVLGIDIAATQVEQAAYLAWARDGTDLISTVGQDLVAGLDQHIMEAARKGTLTRDLRGIVEDRLGVSTRHAQLIARDQIAKLNGKITEATHKAAGITRYKWRSSRDQRTRPDHRALDGTIQAWGDPPVVDQRTGRRAHPGDDFQCFLGDSPVSGVFVAGVRGHYEGPAIHLQTSGGRRLSVTANHPVLTSRGFVAASDLRVDDDVVCDLSGVDLAESVDPHDRPALASEVFGLLAMVGRVDRVAVRAEDFHGDGAGHKGDVDVVRAGRALPDNVNSASLQGGGDLSLPHPDTGDASLVRPGDLGLRGVRLGDASTGTPRGGTLAFGGSVDLLESLPLQTLSLRPTTDHPSALSDEPRDLRPLEAGGSGDLKHGRPVVVSVQDLADRGVGNLGGGARGADFSAAPSGKDRSVEHLPVHPEALGSVGDRLSSRVTLEKVVKVDVEPGFSGHVYSLQTTTGLVVSDGIITSNCRCVAIPVVDDED